jgi:hypothetical protein
MRKALGITLMLVVALAVTAYARPADQEGSLDKFISMQDAETDFVPTTHLGVFGTAQQGTTFYGGTVAGVTTSNGRGPWIAIKNGTWTFDTGTGSVMAPNLCNDGMVNPYKYGCPNNPAIPGTELHTYMEGWIGWDATYSELTYFRRFGYADFAAESADTCVGALVGLGGQYSLWCGVMPSEANANCYAAGQGYGNSWNICIGQQFTYDGNGGNVVWEYDYVVDTEPGWDYAYALVDTSTNNDVVAVGTYTGPIPSAHATHALAPGLSMRSDAGPYVLKWCGVADGAYSDEDGLYVTTCGMVAVDDVSVTGGGVLHASDFETGADGWVLQPAAEGAGGEWADIVHISTLPPVLTVCGCDLVDSVLVFEDKSVGGHGLYQDNLAASPWIDLLADGLAGTPGKFVRFDGYFELPLINYIFVQTNVQWWPAVCPQTGLLYVHPFMSDGFVRYFGGVPTCRRFAEQRQVDLDYSDVIDLGAEEMRIALGVINYCRYYPDCSGTTNSTPWFDEVRMGVYGNPNAPFITVSTIDTPQDAFPTNGTLRIDATGRVDTNNVKGDQNPAPGTVLGDTLIVSGGSGGAEVWVEFYVRPGPGTNLAAFNTWYNSHAPGVTRVGPWGIENWKVARLDTAEVSGVVATSPTWMSTYHELDPNFQINDTALDPADQAVHPGALLNEVFPDFMFTAGTRLNLFYKTAFTPSAGMEWFLLPDTTDGNFIEMEIMPSSMDPDSMFNCALYVDHFDGRGAQPFIENALAIVMPGAGYNYEKTAWDRFDVEAPSSGQGSVGRPLNCDYGATVVQLLGYKDIKWNSGNLNATNLSQEDANVLIPWLSIVEPGLGFNNFYGSGDGLAESIETEAVKAPAAKRFLNDFCGVTFVCGRVGDAGCEPGSPAKPDTCIDLNPQGGYLFAYETARSVQHQGQGNGCPTQRSFDVLEPFVGGVGIPLGDEEYFAASVPWTTQFASVANEAIGGPDYKTVIDGVSVHYRRDPSDCTFSAPPQTAVEERLREVQTWFGYEGLGGGGGPFLCEDATAGTSVPGDLGRTATFKTALANFAPNPLVGGAVGTIQFTMAREGAASVEIFDVSGRLVKTVLDGIAMEGLNTAHWNGTDEAGRSVASGVYFYRLKAQGDEFAKKLVIVRN